MFNASFSNISAIILATSVRDQPFNWKGGLWFFASFRIFFSDNTRIRIFIFLSRKARNYFPVFNIRLYESDYFFFLHQNQNIFFSNIGNQNIFFVCNWRNFTWDTNSIQWTTGTCFIQKLYAPSSSLLQGKHLPFFPSPLHLNIFCLFVILSLTQLYRYIGSARDIFLFDCHI